MGGIMDRYFKNMNMLSKEENESLKNYKVCVVGCGGLGGFIIEELGRLGIGHITAIDGDIFDESNLNRQLLAHTENLGQPKALAAKERMAKVNPDVSFNAITEKITKDNGLEILKGHNLVIDAVDNIETRFLLKDIASEAGIPLIHGAIAGWYGQVSVIFPGDDTLDKIYPRERNKGVETKLGNPSFTPALIASVEVSEALKVLIKRGDLLRNKLLHIDLYEHTYEVITL
jgi:molybdopterin-synthase adenylyltransferase